MKHFLILCLSVGLFSCKEEPKTATTTGTDAPQALPTSAPSGTGDNSSLTSTPGTTPGVPASGEGTSKTPVADAKPGVPAASETTVIIDKTTGRPNIVSRPKDALSTAISKTPVIEKDPTPPRPVPPAAGGPTESRVIRVLTTNYWVVWALHRIKNPSNETNQGAWFKFNMDGTYDYGFFQKPIARGAWTFDVKTATLHLDSELSGDDREWTLKIGKDEDVMVWLGTERYLTTDIQLKLENFMFIPKTRKEIGLED